MTPKQPDDRPRCPICGLPFSGEGPLCQFGDECRAAYGLATAEENRRTAPPKSANRGQGGRGHGHLRFRRFKWFF